MRPLRRLLELTKFLKRELYAKLDPIGYARYIGVQIGEGTVFYGMPSGMFGSEPFLIRIGKNCHITSGVQFVTHDGGPLILRHEYPDLDYTAPITVGDYVYVGMRSIILPGVCIGNRCVIGAGSVVTKSIQENSVAVGAPATVICSLDEYLRKLEEKSTGLGHLKGLAKEAAYVAHFKVTHKFHSMLSD
jgi:carbonic anhydrase/acetyltransferase-like protein (isoleucine patch superfamily)